MIWSQLDFGFFVGKPFRPTFAGIPVGFCVFFFLWYEKTKQNNLPEYVHV